MLWWKDQRGAAFIIVFMAVLVLFLTGTTLLEVAATERKISINHIDDVKALYIADAGINKFLAGLQDNPNFSSWPADWDKDFTNIPIGDGFLASLNVQQSGNELTVTSVGEIRRPDGSVKAKKSMYAVVEVLPYVPAFVVGKGEDEILTFTGNFTIIGDLIYNGSLRIGPSTTVTGDVTLGGNLENQGRIDGDVRAGGYIDNNGTITGYTKEYASVSLPEISSVDYEKWKAKADVVYGEDQELKQEDLTGMDDKIIYVKGDVTIGKTRGRCAGERYSGTGLIVAEENVYLNCDLTPADAESNLVIISQQNIAVGRNAKNVQGVLVSEGTYTTNGNVDLEGYLMARTINASGNNKLIYNDRFLNDLHFDLPGSGIKIKEWRELHPVIREPEG